MRSVTGVIWVTWATGVSRMIGATGVTLVTWVLGNRGGDRRRPEKERKEVEVRRKRYEDHHMRIIIYEDYHMILIFWQRTARVLGFQKMFGLFGLNHHILEKTCDVTPGTFRMKK